jgi:hypothetical protein
VTRGRSCNVGTPRAPGFWLGPHNRRSGATLPGSATFPVRVSAGAFDAATVPGCPSYPHAVASDLPLKDKFAPADFAFRQVNNVGIRILCEAFSVRRCGSNSAISRRILIRAGELACDLPVPVTVVSDFNVGSRRPGFGGAAGIARASQLGSDWRGSQPPLSHE